MKIRLIRNSRLAKFLKVEGIVLYPYIVCSAKKPSVKTINHELIHILQVKRHGFFRFYFTYLKEYIQFRKSGFKHMEAYLAISFEVEAYSHQNDLTYSGLWATEFLSFS